MQTPEHHHHMLHLKIYHLFRIALVSHTSFTCVYLGSDLCILRCSSLTLKHQKAEKNTYEVVVSLKYTILRALILCRNKIFKLMEKGRTPVAQKQRKGA